MIEHLVIEIGDYVVNLYGDASRINFLVRKASQGKGTPLGGKYYYRKDAPHAPTGQYHLHVYERQNELFAINWDGSAHDASHGVLIPNRVMTALPNIFPSIALPENGRIATYDPSSLQKLTKVASVVGLDALTELQQISRTIPVNQRNWPSD